ncbi:redoxin family protein [Oribacterium sp. oral taxon 078 str. F0263]|uniref:TlpA disulfide reductase family protein n=1 Tax=Oribacterium sp. oral taxon 078 TaxID=652706 RepID=UPI0003AE50C2|nr:TlpA disulfide reductase family protein [Oribacterium sp. oral taxon 078]ERL22309.1 redoxin family protein [Oribacterium sp. oral taxon 078 str. F0263]
MRGNGSRAAALMLSLGLCFGLTACGGKKEEKAAGSPAAESVAAMDGMNIEQAGMSDESFKPADYAWQRSDKYEFPYMGVSFSLPEKLLSKMDQKEIAMFDDSLADEKGGFRYFLVSWNKLTKEQREAEVKKIGDGYTNWMKSLSRVGTIGMYASDMTEEEIKELTRCSTQKKIGESSDGKYVYYMGTDPSASEEERGLIEEIGVTIGEREEMSENGASVPAGQSMTASGTASIAPLSTKTIDGADFSEKDFSDYDLTMVNVFATWCTACVQEIPDLEKLRQEMKDKGVNVVGVVTDTRDESGEENQEAIEKAKLIQAKTKAGYPFLIPDSSYLNGRVKNLQAMPETFFVDKNGNIVGDSYSGSRSLKDWKEIVEKEQKKLKESGS